MTGPRGVTRGMEAQLIGDLESQDVNGQGAEKPWYWALRSSKQKKSLDTGAAVSHTPGGQWVTARARRPGDDSHAEENVF